ncbi:MAG: glycosyltransferase [Nitrososphaerales archaeon]
MQGRIIANSLRVLQVIHGYPPRYNAGSEVYTQTLSRGLAGQGHSVSVFSRKEDPFRPDYELTTEAESTEPRITLFVVNLANGRDRYRHAEVDARFDEVLDRTNPEVVHIGHLNHLSTSMVERASRRRIPIVFTLHDYWLMCPRGQFLQANIGGEQWALCDGQEDRKCSVHCYSRYYTGLAEAKVEDEEYWTIGLRIEWNTSVRWWSALIFSSRLQNTFETDLWMSLDFPATRWSTWTTALTMRG